jgi:uncharacterized protein
MRVAPRVWIGFAVTVGYMAIVVSVQAASGVPYTGWSESARNLFVGADLSLIIGAVALAVVVTALGWWGPVLRDRERSRHRWPIIAPVILAAIAVVGLVGADWNAVSGAVFYVLRPVAGSLVLAMVLHERQDVNSAEALA